MTTTEVLYDPDADDLADQLAGQVDDDGPDYVESEAQDV